MSAAHMREYETVYVLNPEIADDAAVAFIEKMRGLVEREGGKHLKVTNWGRKKLAWERQKQQRGMFVHHLYLGQAGIVHEYERTLAIEESVLLRQTVLINPSVDPNTRMPETDVVQPPINKEKEEKERRRYDDDDGDFGRDRLDDDMDFGRDRGDLDD